MQGFSLDSIKNYLKILWRIILRLPRATHRAERVENYHNFRIVSVEKLSFCKCRDTASTTLGVYRDGFERFPKSYIGCLTPSATVGGGVGMPAGAPPPQL
jgi:hypothetical protein